MFTGIIRHLGTVTATTTTPTGRYLSIATSLAPNLHEGNSIAVNGACLTVETKTDTEWTAHLMQETLRKTNLGILAVGDKVNLEEPVKIGETLDGHFVQGHVDGVTTILNIQAEGTDRMFTFMLPPTMRALLIPKGSIALDGVSLTVVDLTSEIFRVSIMPYTIAHTTFQYRTPGDLINIETDMLGKYIAQHATAYATVPEYGVLRGNYPTR